MNTADFSNETKTLMTINTVTIANHSSNDNKNKMTLYFSGLQSISLTTGSSIAGRSTHTHTHTRLMALFPGLPGSAGTRKAKPIWILLKQETVSGSGISWAICKSAPCSRQITTPAHHRSDFYRPDALPAAQPTASEH